MRSEPSGGTMMGGWIKGLPKGNLTEAMLRDFEVYFSPIGVKWHRERTEEEKLAYDERKRSTAAVDSSIQRSPTKE